MNFPQLCLKFKHFSRNHLVSVTILTYNALNYVLQWTNIKTLRIVATMSCLNRKKVKLDHLITWTSKYRLRMQNLKQYK